MSIRFKDPFFGPNLSSPVQPYGLPTRLIDSRSIETRFTSCNQFRVITGLIVASELSYIILTPQNAGHALVDRLWYEIHDACLACQCPTTRLFDKETDGSGFV
jgi:hypothetical protein